MNKTEWILKQLEEAAARKGQFDFSRSYYQKHRPELCSVANSPLNRQKNLYNRWGFPYDHNLIDSIPHYINASPMPIKGKRYIAAQGPRNNTLNEFWHMVWAEKASLIVSVTNEREYGTSFTEIKFDRFWPPQGTETHFGPFSVRCLEETLLQEWHDGREEKLRKRQLSLKQGNSERNLVHLHMENWPDTGVIHPTSLFALSQHAKNWDQESVIVHCAAGVGRTGTFIAFHSLYCELLEQLHQDLPKIDVAARVQEMRSMRWGAIVSESKQYELVIEALRYALPSINR